MAAYRPVVLCILDGWGDREARDGNAPLLAETPTVDAIRAKGPVAQLITHGPDAGLPQGQMGNSEVGHTNIGAGRVVAMDLGQIDLAIEDGSYFENARLLAFVEALKASGGTAHLMGVASDGGVHGHWCHVITTARMIAEAGVPVAIHAMTDGRDVAPKSAHSYLEPMKNAMPDGARIATVSGRYFAMDRDNRWERVEKAWRAMVLGDGASADDPCAAVDAAYADETTDEFIPPTVIGDFGGMADGDGVFCLNFRADRAREILSAIGKPDFDAFDVSGRPEFAALLGMVQYSDAHESWFETVFPKRRIENTLGEWVAKEGLRQFRLAETEKYPHVTFFLNGGREVEFEGEARAMPASPKVATYDMQPKMSAEEVTDRFVEAIEAGYDLIVCNYANPDMVGHTGDLDAAIAACEAVDRGLARVVAALEAAGGAMVLTADHGNCEMMIDPDTGGPHTSHTLNPVPLMLVGVDRAELASGRLADLAPTVLELMGLTAPSEMTGQSLLRR